MGSGGGSATNWGALGGRRSAQMLRMYSVRNVWVRVAINRRKRELAKAKWAIVRVDDPKAPADPAVVRQATELFEVVNDAGMSLTTIINMMVEDLLVIDAGVLEIETTAGGKLAALWPIPGEEIAPDPSWDGSNPNASRYYQWRNGRPIAEYTNGELVYMMANPRTVSAVGLSPLEVLMETVEAELFGSSYELELMKQTAPAGLLFLGGGVPPDKVEAFRDQWEAELAGSRDIAILGGGGFDPETGTMSTPPTWTPFGRSGRDEQRREYMRWLAAKVASCFEMDMLAFNLSEAVHKSVGESIQLKTDQGLLGLASVIESYFTREIIRKIDPSKRHGFAFTGLIPTDALGIAKQRQMYMNMGVTTPNEIRAEDGRDPVPWGDVPWPGQVQAKTDDPAGDDQHPPDGDDPPEPPPEPDADDEGHDDE